MRTTLPATGEAKQPDTLQEVLKHMEAALLCLDEGNISRAGTLLYMAIKAARQQ